MQKKRSENKLNLPAVGIVKPSESSKNYTAKANLNKCRQIQQKNIYFEMPSIHQNDLTMKAFLEGQDKNLKKLQIRMLKMFENWKQNKLGEEWDLYMKKSDILNTRNFQFNQIEQFLVKNIVKLALKLNENQLNNTFSFNKSLRSSNCYDPQQFKESFTSVLPVDSYNRTMLLEDKVMSAGDDRNSKMAQTFNKSIFDDKSKQYLNNTDIFSWDPINHLNHQNVILQKKADLYQKRICQLQNSLSKLQDKDRQNVSEKDVNMELMEIMVSRNKLKYEVEVKAMQIETLSRELNLTKNLFRSIKQQYDQLEEKYKKSQLENIEFKEYLKYKELWLMSSEETISWRTMQSQQREEKQKYLGKIKLLKDKNKQLLNYFNMSSAVNPDQQEDKQDLDKIIKQFKDWLMIISVPKVAHHQQSSTPDQEQEFMNVNEVNVKLLRPNFYIFFEAFENTLLMEKNIINIRPIQYNFFLKIRTIFDTLFTNFQIARNYKEYPNFPEYVIGFLEKYQLNSETNKLQYRRKPIQNQQKITFLVNLFNKNFCNTWECDIFKNFLFQNYYLDEIYFFLDCRNQFNSGISSSYTLGSADPISYVKLGKALKVVARKLAPYQNYIVERVKNILKSKKKVKFGEAFIDKHFVLKILLQVYALEKSKSERIFQSSFKSKMKKSYITYGDFHNFMNKNFTFLSSIDIAQLYREIYSLSSGHITYKAIHYICGMKGLFIPLMLDKRMNKGSAQQSLGNDMLLLDIQNNITKMSSHFQELGLQNLMRAEHSINDFMRQLNWYRNNKAAFYQRLHLQKCNILKINTLIQIKSSYELTPSEVLDDAEVQTQMIQLHSLLHQVDSQVHHLGRQRDKRAKSMKMLVRNFKIRIQQSILQFQKVNEEQIKKLRDQIQKSKEQSQLKQVEKALIQNIQK